MRKLYLTLGIVVVMAATLIWIWPWIKMDIADSAYYTEQDTPEYAFYTPKILKEMPRISAEYTFSFKNIMGPDIQVHEVTFYNTRDTQNIEAYLSSMGYLRQNKCSSDLVCWRGAEAEQTIYVGHLTSEKAVIVQVVEEYH